MPHTGSRTNRRAVSASWLELEPAAAFGVVGVAPRNIQATARRNNDKAQESTNTQNKNRITLERKLIAVCLLYRGLSAKALAAGLRSFPLLYAAPLHKTAQTVQPECMQREKGESNEKA